MSEQPEPQPEAIAQQWDISPQVPVLPAKPKRPFPWRWAGALAAAVVVGAGCAFAMMAPQRADLPGLKTATDGRYVFAPLSLPTLAPGQLTPDDLANIGEQHLADIRKLLLPAPQGAVDDEALELSHGWLSEADSEKLTTSDAARLDFGEYGWRHTAAESWKTTDGAETKIYLLQFGNERNAAAAFTILDDMTGEPSNAATSLLMLGSNPLTYDKEARGTKNTWYGIAQLHDTVLEIVYTAPSSVGVTPFRQEFSLQAELLE
ncbi:hypothetical protein [Actinospica robiniae]|uniref:hypothetical protein n=1 Tax=Actinospica robiniae TaxID=304901 RepID=UPI000428C110|nr:hypothetical protein [Actinospica robiniae]